MSIKEEWCPLFGKLPHAEDDIEKTLLDLICKMREIWNITQETERSNVKFSVLVNAKILYKNAPDWILKLDNAQKSDNLHIPLPSSPADPVEENKAIAILGIFAAKQTLELREQHHQKQATLWFKQAKNLSAEAGSHHKTHKNIINSAKKKAVSEQASTNGKDKEGSQLEIQKLINLIVNVHGIEEKKDVADCLRSITNDDDNAIDLPRDIGIRRFELVNEGEADEALKYEHQTRKGYVKRKPLLKLRGELRAIDRMIKIARDQKDKLPSTDPRSPEEILIQDLLILPAIKV